MILISPKALSAEPELTSEGWFDPRPTSGETQTWNYEDEIYITGVNLLGKSHAKHGLPKDYQLCFMSETQSDYSQCFNKENTDVIKSWTTNSIAFVSPSNAYVRGTIILRYNRYVDELCSFLYGKKYCIEELEWGDDTHIGYYKLYPLIMSVTTDDGDPVTAISIGSTYKIHGVWFGSSKAPIFLNGTQIPVNDVLTWNGTTATFKPSKNVGNLIRVKNATSKSPEFNISDQEDANDNEEESAGEIITGDSSFADVTSSHPYGPAIQWGKSSGVLQGYPDGTFRPDKAVNRAEFLKVILESDDRLDISSATIPAGFPDVDENAWYAPYIRYAKANGIVDGYPDGTFQPEKTVNFAEALKIAYGAVDVPTESVSGEWYARFIAHAKYNNVLFTNEVNIGSNMTRKDVVWIVWKLIQMR